MLLSGLVSGLISLPMAAQEWDCTRMLLSGLVSRLIRATWLMAPVAGGKRNKEGGGNVNACVAWR